MLLLIPVLFGGALLCAASQYAYVCYLVARASVQFLSHDDSEIRLMLNDELICSCFRILHCHGIAFAVSALPTLSAFRCSSRFSPSSGDGLSTGWVEKLLADGFECLSAGWRAVSHLAWAEGLSSWHEYINFDVFVPFSPRISGRHCQGSWGLMQCLPMCIQLPYCSL